MTARQLEGADALPCVLCRHFHTPVDFPPCNDCWLTFQHPNFEAAVHPDGFPEIIPSMLDNQDPPP